MTAAPPESVRTEAGDPHAAPLPPVAEGLFTTAWLSGVAGADLRALLTEAQLAAVHEALDAQSSTPGTGPDASQVWGMDSLREGCLVSFGTL